MDRGCELPDRARADCAAHGHADVLARLGGRDFDYHDAAEIALRVVAYYAVGMRVERNFAARRMLDVTEQLN